MNLVTGAAGHLGNVLVRALIERGEAVRALVLPGENIGSLDGLPVELISGNVLDPPSLDRAVEGVDTVFHMAALVSLLEEHAAILRKVNVEGTHNMLRAAQAAGVRRFVYTSSIHALTRPEAGVTIDETQPFDPHNPAGAYDRTKAAASIAVQQAAADGFHAVIACPTGVIGPYDFRRSEMGEMILTWMNSPYQWLVSGSFDFVDVRDVAEGHIRARDEGRPGETYILGGSQIRVDQLCSLVMEQVRRRARVIQVPDRLAMLAAGMAEKYYHLTHTRPSFTRYSLETLLSNSLISTRKAGSELGYRPRGLFETVRDTVAWWVENKAATMASVRI